MLRVVLYHLAPIFFPWALMLFPLALYLLFLGWYVNRRAHPLMVRGDISFLGVVLALAGFLLIGPPSWLADPFRMWGHTAYPIAYGCYLVLTIALLWSYLKLLRHQSVIYNLSPEELPGVMRSALEALALPYQATAGRIAIADGQLVLEVEASTAWYTATISWLGPDQSLRGGIEQAVRDRLATVTTSENPCRWLLLLWGGFLMLFSLFGIQTGIWFLSLQGP